MTNHQKNEIERMRRQGSTPAAIAEAMHLPLATIRSYIYRHPLKEQETVCPNCGASILAENRGKKKRRFCSDSCRMAWWNNNQDQINRQAYYPLKCHHCGKDFMSYAKKRK